MVVHTWNVGIRETEAGRSGQGPGQPRLQSETLHLKTKATKNEDTHTPT